MPIQPAVTNKGEILVDWYTTDDAANPQNWTPGAKYLSAFIVCIYTFAVYSGKTLPHDRVWSTANTSGQWSKPSSTKAAEFQTNSVLTLISPIGSAIYTPSEGGVQAHFKVSPAIASSGLALYVLGYGMGPLLFSPLSEVPRFGRNPTYVATFAVFVLLCIPTALVNDIGGFIFLRFLQGFFGSPCLATAPATMQDMFSLIK